jgi:hypothetical protein
MCELVLSFFVLAHRFLLVACSCAVLWSEFKLVNPRYGAGGYRKSDPVTRYQAYNNKWQSSKFLNKKTNKQQGAKLMQKEWQA